ncbi:putative helicase MOV-10 [Mya arenaria]|uniref:putative helicase MOV-10 n=1 Tax=Mya arenaria TaxID=6604 RepID=UPI0022E0FE0D|nr:putative helicase MOV-10 [Mya arenaria]XP_052781824.1 putative helicase MOV-10 [Mya arenaria]
MASGVDKPEGLNKPDANAQTTTEKPDRPDNFLKPDEKTRTSTFREVFSDFQRFLQTEQRDIDGMLKEDLKNVYIGEYSQYRQQISPDQSLPSFFKLFRILYQQNIAHFEGDKIVLGPMNGKTVKRVRNKGRKSNEKKANLSPFREPVNQLAAPAEGVHVQTPANEQSTQNYSKKHFMNRNKYAVDQHLTFKNGLRKVVELPEFEGDIALWKHVGKTLNNNVYFCTVCQSKCNSLLDMDQHVNGRRHRLANSIKAVKSKKRELVTGMAEVRVSCKKTDKLEMTGEGVLQMMVREGDTMLADLVLQNVSTVPVELAHCEMMKKCRVFTLQDSSHVTDGMGKTAVIRPGQSYTVTVRAQPQHCGSYHCPVMFHMVAHHPATPQTGYILRYLHCRCKNSVLDELQPTSEYKKPPRTNKLKGKALEVVPGFKLPSWSGDCLERKLELGQYSVPPDDRRMINRGLAITDGLTEQECLQIERLRNEVESDLTMSGYVRRFSSLLFFEEVQMEVDIRRYDMEDVQLRPYPANRRLLLLQVPGLCENRPSVLRGDWLYVRNRDPNGQLGTREYQGFVHDVHQNDVALGFHNSFRDSYVEKQSYNVRFVFNRLPSRLQHRALQLADELSLGPILFPEEQHIASPTPLLPSLKLYNSDLERNHEQLCAVQHIVAGTSRPAPYLVFGPPGTGKTVTIVEAIKQVWKQSRGNRVLACTPSNSAADLITKRLIKHIPATEILRLNAASRSLRAIPQEIRVVCNYDNSRGQFQFPSKAILSEYRIIVTTLVTAGRLVSASFPPGHFSHIFIDEAGHAPEPEAIIAVAGIMEVNPALRTGGQVVIAGDHKQLGPVLRSPLAIKYGLDISLLERYMDCCHLYRPVIDSVGHKSYDVRVVTKLLNNYRSHPDILKLPNELFYESELKPCASIDREKLCQWAKLPVKGFPVLFHGVAGEDMREERSPSFFNPVEVAVVTKYVEELLACRTGGINLKPADIGVISPYRKQVQKIQQVLRKKHLEDVSVGSVEEFQGQERTVIIVSTVRSNPQYMSLDMTYKLGFLKNPKRFNVTVTRAKALLIVVGNPNTLGGDEYWRQLIEYCEDNGSYVGIERERQEEEMEDLIQRLQAIDLIDEELNMIPEIQSNYNEQAWRSDL